MSGSISVQPARVRLSRATYVVLTEWQLCALREGLAKPSYSDLVDTMVALIEANGFDVVAALEAASARAAS